MTEAQVLINKKTALDIAKTKGVPTRDIASRFDGTRYYHGSTLLFSHNEFMEFVQRNITTNADIISNAQYTPKIHHKGK
jgi:hypothetical protein